MTNRRIAILHEMGLSPYWKMRRPPAVEEPLASALTEAPALHDSQRDVVLTGATPEMESIESMNWEAWHEALSQCERCGLCAARKQVVPGVGDREASWLFIGEGPGAEEDARGEPFVGQAGQLLDAMLAAIGLKRGEGVYIANAVKCRPPANRTPEASELKACWPYLRRQIQLIRPKLIVLLGKVAVHSVLGEEGTLSGMRGKTFYYQDGELNIPVLVTYHPAYLLRNLPDKAKAWEDLCHAEALMASM